MVCYVQFINIKKRGNEKKRPGCIITIYGKNFGNLLILRSLDLWFLIVNQTILSS